MPSPSVPQSRSAPKPQRPYRMDTPLSHTAGIPSCLRLLCAGGNDVLWRELAEGLGEFLSQP